MGTATAAIAALDKTIGGYSEQRFRTAAGIVAAGLGVPLHCIDIDRLALAVAGWAVDWGYHAHKPAQIAEAFQAHCEGRRPPSFLTEDEQAALDASLIVHPA
jgi:hypothetical protein